MKKQDRVSNDDTKELVKIDQALEENVKRGVLKYGKVNKNGERTYKISDLGAKCVESMPFEDEMDAFIKGYKLATKDLEK